MKPDVDILKANPSKPTGLPFGILRIDDLNQWNSNSSGSGFQFAAFIVPMRHCQ